MLFNNVSLNVIAALSLFSSLFLLSFSLFHGTIYAISNISMQLCVTFVLKLCVFHMQRMIWKWAFVTCSQPVTLSAFRCVIGVKSFQFMLHTELNRQNPLKRMKREIKSVGGGEGGYFCQADCLVHQFTSYVFPWYEHCSLTPMLTENTC